MREQLLRQALESGKTVSKKQRTKQESAASSGIPSRSSSKANSAANSRAGSAATSRTGSRVGSSTGSDDEFESLNGYESDGNASEFDFTAKLDAELEGVADSWERALEARLNNIINRGKRRTEERLDDLRWYTGLLQNHYASEEVQSQTLQIVKQLLRASTSESEKEATLALKALSITVITDQNEDYFELCSGPLKSIVQNSGDEDVKAAALHTLSLITFFSGTASDAVSVLIFLLEIIESDGSHVLAGDSAPVVAAATRALSLLVSKLPDLDPDADYLQDIDREFSEEAIAALSEQLESSAASVQVAAAEALALLFEKSYRRATLDDQDKLEEDVHTGERPDVIQKYSPYRQTNQLVLQLQEASKGSNKSAAKGDRRLLHDALRDVLQSIENPGFGPGWRAGQGWKAKGRDDRQAGQNRDLGPSIRIKTDPQGHAFVVQSWWAYVRVRELRNILGHGFMEHFADNEIVEQTLYQEFEGVEDDEEESDNEPEPPPMPKMEAKDAKDRGKKGRKSGGK